MRTAKWLDVVHSLFVVHMRAKDDAWHLSGKHSLPGRVAGLFRTSRKRLQAGSGSAVRRAQLQTLLQVKLAPKGPSHPVGWDGCWGE